jgi:hypothetical protein
MKQTLYVLFKLFFFFSFILFTHFVEAQSVADTSREKILKIIITFNGVPSKTSVQKAPLKYNKDFAYSLTLDDGLVSAYTSAFKLLNGGYLEENNTTYPGLFYTDGCGNNVPFRGGLAWYSLNSERIDLHVSTPKYMTWDQLKEMHGAGWGVFNHSLTHAAKGEDIDYNFQVTEGARYIKEKAGIDAIHFVIPSGDTNYVDPAFNNKMVAVYNQSNDFPGAGGLRVDSAGNFNKFRLWRKFLEDQDDTPANISESIDEVAAKSVNGEKYWYNDFTHSVGFEQTGGSLIFSTFEHYMNHIANTYGKGGKDNIWVASLQEVYEYLQVRDMAAVSSSMNGERMEVQLDLNNIPANIRHHALSLLVDSDKDITSIEVLGNPTYTYRGTGNAKLLNLEWSQDLVVTSAIAAVQQEEETSKLTLYPNPAGNNSVNILVENLRPHEELQLQFSDLTGRVVYIHQLEADGAGKVSAQLDTKNILFKGIYIVTATTPANVFRNKLIVE